MAEHWRTEMLGVTAEQPSRHRLTVEEYYRMGEVGILRPDERVELIEGEIIDMAPLGSLHAGTVDQLAEVLRRAVSRQALVRVQSPVRLDKYSEPQPDLALLRPRSDYYKSAHPGAADVLLIVEVADTSLRYDRDVKLSLYARHGIPEAWLLDVRAKRLTRCRDPRDGTYARIDEPAVRPALDLAALPGVKVSLRELFSD